MGLSAAFIDAHITAWEAHLTGVEYPHRSKWPSRLFHHTPIENAVEILRSGKLLSRVDSEQGRARDVAGPGVITARDRAHNVARLYFRPRTPTQYHIEGIRKAGECQFGESAHAPVLVMLVFDARRVLQLDGLRVSNANMQSPGTADGDSEQFFISIPFEKVYHEGAHSDGSITKHRCAEILAPSPMSLDGMIQWIYCRSNAERETLLHLLGEDRLSWQRRVIVSDDLRVFEKRFAYTEEVSLAKNGVIFKLASRRDTQPIHVHVELWNLEGRKLANFEGDLLARPPSAEAWRIESALDNGDYRVRITLENHRAYENILTLGEVPF